MTPGTRAAVEFDLVGRMARDGHLFPGVASTLYCIYSDNTLCF